MASAETARDLLLHSITALREHLLPAMTIRVILFPADIFNRTQNHTDRRQEADSPGQSLQETFYINHVQQSQQEAKERGKSRRMPNMASVSAGWETGD